MKNRKNIFVIIGSASLNSANEKLVRLFEKLTKNDFNLAIFTDLKSLPHFNPELSLNEPPQTIIKFRENIENADAIIICTPEYVFSIPSGLKNAIEWCVATTVFSNKPTGLITASADGHKGHEELKLIMKTVLANFSDKTTLLISGIKGKINEAGQISDQKTEKDLNEFIDAFNNLVKESVVDTV
jgi:NAD(P)H-dependent FMN reductase